MLKSLKKMMGLEPKESKSPTDFEVGVINNRLVIKFNRPVMQLELDRLQTLNLIEALTSRIVMVSKKK